MAVMIVTIVIVVVIVVVVAVVVIVTVIPLRSSAPSIISIKLTSLYMARVTSSDRYRTMLGRM